MMSCDVIMWSQQQDDEISALTTWFLSPGFQVSEPNIKERRLDPQSPQKTQQTHEWRKLNDKQSLSADERAPVSRACSEG